MCSLHNAKRQQRHDQEEPDRQLVEAEPQVKNRIERRVLQIEPAAMQSVHPIASESKDSEGKQQHAVI